MNTKDLKRKLKRRGVEIYNKYFFNDVDTLNYIVECIDNNIEIDENQCQTIFNISNDYLIQIYELIMYYPNKLKEIKYIDNQIIDNLYNEFSDTINIMKLCSKTYNIRGKLSGLAQQRSKELNRECNIISEDIKLNTICPYLNIPINYNNNVASFDSPSLDRIDNSKGYTKDNIQVISHLANSMKSYATNEQLIEFSKNVLKLHC